MSRWEIIAKANAAALNNMYEYIGTRVGPIPAQEHMKDCAIDPVILVGHMIETIEKRINATTS